MTTPIRQRGVALLVALLVVALAAVLIAALLDRGELAYARTRNALRSEQADAYAQGLEIYAAQVLAKVQQEQPNSPDTHQSPWAQPMPPQPVPGGVIAARMSDVNGCFNLNNLSPRVSSATRSQWSQVFARLVGNVGINDPALGGAVQSWLDPTGQAGPVSASFYLAQPVPYRPRGDVFTHVSELRLVAGVTADVYARLAPYVCALPPGTRLNLNTSSAVMLQSFLDITAAQATRLWNNGQANSVSIDAFSQTAKTANIPLANMPQGLSAVSSTYLLARADILLDDVPFTYYSLIERPLPNSGASGIRVIARSRGSDDALTAAAPIAPSDDHDTLD